jgi:hypothetical protein
MKFLETGDKLWDKGSRQIYTKNQCIQRGDRTLAIIFNHPASNGGIPSGSDGKTFKTGAVLKKSSVIANCTSQRLIGGTTENPHQNNRQTCRISGTILREPSGKSVLSF